MLICQLTNCTPVQMMGYVIKTKNGKLIVIDGGGYGQGAPLEKVIKDWGGKVDMWFITHNHSDHYASVMELVRGGADIEIAGFWRNNCTGAAKDALPENEKKELDEWLEFESECNIPMHQMHLGEKFCIDGVGIEVIGVDNPEITVNNPNNQSVVLRLSEGEFSMIFLGDLGVEGGEKLTETAGGKIRATAVQMAHHGQCGVDFDVYEKIGANFAFWPTPKWLWDNTPYLGGEPGKGSFKTPETIKWAEKLGMTNITSFDNNTVFDTEKQKIVD